MYIKESSSEKRWKSSRDSETSVSCCSFTDPASLKGLVPALWGQSDSYRLVGRRSWCSEQLWLCLLTWQIMQCVSEKTFLRLEVRSFVIVVHVVQSILLSSHFTYYFFTSWWKLNLLFKWTQLQGTNKKINICFHLQKEPGEMLHFAKKKRRKSHCNIAAIFFFFDWRS